MCLDAEITVMVQKFEFHAWCLHSPGSYPAELHCIVSGRFSVVLLLPLLPPFFSLPHQVPHSLLAKVRVSPWLLYDSGALASKEKCCKILFRGLESSSLGLKGAVCVSLAPGGFIWLIQVVRAVGGMLQSVFAQAYGRLRNLRMGRQQIESSTKLTLTSNTCSLILAGIGCIAFIIKE